MKKGLLIISAFILLSAKSDELLQKANSFKMEQNFGMALEMYQNALIESIQEGHKEVTIEATRQLGMLNYQLKNYIKSEWYFEKLIDNETCEADVLFKYARLQQINGRQERAKEFYQKWSNKTGDSTLSKPYIDFCNLIISGDAVSKVLNVFPMPFNSAKYDEYCPVVTNGKLVFTSNRPTEAGTPTNTIGHYFTDLFQTDNLNYQGGRQTNLFSSSLKSIYNESAAAFSPNGNTIYFTGNNLKEAKLFSNGKGSNNLGIFKSDFNGYKWSKPELLPFVTAGFNYAFPAISSDGNSLYFSSDMPNSAGGMDIYKSENISGGWSTPVNLGDHINSTNNEVYPFFVQNGNEITLYFSADGKPGYGGLDLFASKIVDGKAESANILPAPVNSSFDDFGYWTNSSNTFGYVSSNRNGSDDIFYFKKSDDVLNNSDQPKVVEIEKKSEEKKTESAPEVTKKDIVQTDREKKVPVIEKEEPKIYDLEKEAPISVLGDKDTAPEVSPDKEIKPKKVIGPKKVIEPERETSPAPSDNSSQEEVIEYSQIKNFYIILHSSYSLENIKKYRARNCPNASILHSENNFYMLGLRLPGDVDEANAQFEKERLKYNKGWFYYPKGHSFTD